MKNLILPILISFLSLQISAQTFTGNPTTGSCSPTSVTASPLSHTMTFLGVIYDFPTAGKSTWLYKVVNIGSPGISHTVLPVNTPCLTFDAPNGKINAGKFVISGTSAPFTYNFNMGFGSPVYSSPDPTTQITGVKFDESISGTAYYYYVLTSNPTITQSNFGLKAGKNSINSIPICGPGVPNLNISVWGLDQSYCDTVTIPIQLYANPSGGTFSGPGIVGNTFNPLYANQGLNIIYYTYTSPAGCTYSTQIEVDIVDCDPIILPIKLLDFNGVASSEGINLHWITASETNNDFFTIEKSADNQRWETLGTVKGSGNVAVKKSYEITDNQPFAGNNYYRLKQTDFDGKSETFKPIVINYTNSNVEFGNVYPNPTVDNINLSIKSEVSKKFTIVIINVLGKEIVKDVIQTNENETINYITSIKEFSKGVYMMNIYNGSLLLHSSRIYKTN